MTISDVTNSLFKTAVPSQEVIQELSDEECGFYNSPPYYAPTTAIEVLNNNAPIFEEDEEDEDEDEEYEVDEYEGEYIEGECLDSEEFNTLCTICAQLDAAKRHTESEDHYFYISELNDMRSIINDIKDKAAKLKEISEKYRA